MRRDMGAPGLGIARQPIRITRQVADGAGQRRGVLRRHKDAVAPVLDQFGDAARLGADDGHAHGHGLHVGDAQRFVPGGQDKQMRLGQLVLDRPGVDRAQQLDVVLKMQPLQMRLKLGPIAAASGIILSGDFKPHVTPWGQANRLLAGPIASEARARKLVKALKEEGLDSFTFSSPEGQEIMILQ